MAASDPIQRISAVNPSIIPVQHRHDARQAPKDQHDEPHDTLDLSSEEDVEEAEMLEASEADDRAFDDEHIDLTI